jgi:hypothetical protein
LTACDQNKTVFFAAILEQSFLCVAGIRDPIADQSARSNTVD